MALNDGEGGGAAAAGAEGAAGAGGEGGAAALLGGGTGQLRSEEGAAAVANGPANAAAGDELGHAATVPAALAGEADPDWLTSLSADPGEGDEPSLRDWAKARGYKTLDEVVKSARDNQKAVRDGGRVKVPGEGATPEELASFNKAIGVPDDAKGYQFTAPKGEDGADIPLNTALLERIAEAGHKAGVPKGALEAVVADYVKAQLDEVNASDAANQEAAAKWAKAQGAEAPAKLAAVDKAAAALDLSRAELLSLRAAWGAEKALTVLARLGDGMTEDVLMGGGKARFGVGGAEAQSEMDRLKADPAFQAKVRVPGSAERQRWDRLQAAVGAEADRKAREAG